MFLLNLSKSNIDLSCAEVQAFTKKESVLLDDLLLIEDQLDWKRFAYTKDVLRIIEQTTEEELESALNNIEWNNYYGKSYCVSKLGKLSIGVDKAGSIIWNRLDNPTVDLENPDMEVVLVKKGNIVFITIEEHENKESYENRRQHLRDEAYPISLHPRLARAMVNICGDVNEVMDPFCGTGGILIEAGLIGLSVKGCDINEKMVETTRRTMKKYGIAGNVEVENALKVEHKSAAVATDLPYGKNSPVKDIEKLYSDFFGHAKSLTDRIVVGTPKSIDCKKMLVENGWKVTGEFEVYIHKSMSKKIYAARLDS
ncbi:hypothetical protein JW868_00935 [Candidatus Woesearchaeota archaeon]|nr:hypothetical protein [Candidatus Woesearchaeota archaeon]